MEDKIIVKITILCIQLNIKDMLLLDRRLGTKVVIQNNNKVSKEKSKYFWRGRNRKLISF